MASSPLPTDNSHAALKSGSMQIKPENKKNDTSFGDFILKTSDRILFIIRIFNFAFLLKNIVEKHKC